MKDYSSVIKISSGAHRKIKKYCKNNALKIYTWAEKILLEKIEENKNVNLQNDESN